MTPEELVDLLTHGKSPIQLPRDGVCELRRTDRFGAKGQRLPKQANPGFTVPRREEVAVSGNGFSIVTPPGEWDPIEAKGDATITLDQWNRCDIMGVEVHSAKPAEQGPAPSGKDWEAQAAFLLVACTNMLFSRSKAFDPFGDFIECLGIKTSREEPSIPCADLRFDSLESERVGRNVFTFHAATGVSFSGVHRHKGFRGDLVHWERRYRQDAKWIAAGERGDGVVGSAGWRDRSTIISARQIARDAKA